MSHITLEGRPSKCSRCGKNVTWIANRNTGKAFPVSMGGKRWIEIMGDWVLVHTQQHHPTVCKDRVAEDG